MLAMTKLRKPQRSEQIFQSLSIIAQRICDLPGRIWIIIVLTLYSITVGTKNVQLYAG